MWKGGKSYFRNHKFFLKLLLLIPNYDCSLSFERSCGTLGLARAELRQTYQGHDPFLDLDDEPTKL